MHWLTDPILEYRFFRIGLTAGVVGGALCGFVGVYVVLRRMSYIGHGLAHAILGGAAVSAVVGFNILAGAGAWGLLSAMLISGVARRRKIGADAAIGVITTAFFALGVLLINSAHIGVSLDSLLFGDILGITAGQIWVLLGVSAFTAGVVFLRYRQLLFVTFDPEAADAYGISSRWVDSLFALILAATIVATLRSLGVTLIAATIVFPGVIARLLTDSFAKMLLISTLIGAAAGAAGMYVSFYVESTNVAPGPAIVLILAVTFAIVYVITGVTSRRRLQVLEGTDEHTDLAPGSIGFD
jgi:manganese/iron transport system permease protein/iron/zinc/copper transport system permease protein